MLNNLAMRGQKKRPGQSGNKGLSIFYQLLLYWVGSFVLIGGILTTIIYHSNRKSIQEFTSQQIFSEYETIRQYFNTQTRNIRIDLEMLATNHVLDEYMMSSGIEADIHVRDIKKLFRQYIKEHESYAGITFFDHTGAEQIRVVKEDRVTRGTPRGVDKLFRELESGGHDGFAAMASYDETGLSPLFSIGRVKNDPDIALFGGAIVIDYTLDEIFSHLQGISIFGNNPIWIYSPAGQVLLRPPGDHLSLDPRPFMAMETAGDITFNTVAAGMIIYQDLVIFSGKSLIRVAMSIPDILLQKEIHRTLKFFLIVFAGAFFFICIIASSVSRHLSKPIVELKRAEEKIRQSESRLRESQEVAKIGNWNWTLVDNTLEWSDEAFRRFDKDPATFTPTVDYFVGLIHPDDRAPIQKAIENSLDHDAPYHIQPRIKNENGREWILEGFGRVERDAGGKPMRFTGTVQDITKRKQAEEALRQANDLLEYRVQERTLELQKTHAQLLHAEKLSAIGRLTASIAHEFNNPLYGIKNVIEGIKRNITLDEEYQKLTALALSECDRVKVLIKSLQDFNRPTSGKKEAVDIHTLLDDMIIMIKKDYKNDKISIKKQYAHELPNFQIVPDQMKQVILNLLTNAKDAITDENGTVTIMTENLGSHVAVRFSDTGNGIAQDDLPHIFEPFFTTKSAVKGTGLGLSVSYGIIRAHGGNIEVDSVPGRGTTFSILLPLHEKRDDQTKHTDRRR